MDHKNKSCNQQRQVYEVLRRKPFVDIHSGITSLKAEKNNLNGSETER